MATKCCESLFYSLFYASYSWPLIFAAGIHPIAKQVELRAQRQDLEHTWKITIEEVKNRN